MLLSSIPCCCRVRRLHWLTVGSLWRHEACSLFACAEKQMSCHGAGIWRKYHTHAILQRAEANLWTKDMYEQWEPCDTVDMERHHGYWAVS